MPKKRLSSPFSRHNAAILGIFLFGYLFFTGLYLYTDYQRTQQYLAEQNLQQNRAANLAAKEGISTAILGLRHRLDLFIDSQPDLIQRLINNPGDEELYSVLLVRLKRLFPEVKSFALADESGDVLFEDFEGIIEKTCKADLKRFAHQPDINIVRLHPNPSFTHIDIMTGFRDLVGTPHFFLLNYPADYVTRLLKRYQFPHTQHLLVSLKNPGRIEFTAEAYRHQNNDIEWDQSVEELKQLPFVVTSQVPNTQWILLTYTDAEKLQQDEATLKQRLLSDGGLITLLALLLFPALLYLLKQQQKASQEINYLATHDALTDLYNRWQFINLLTQLLKMAHRDRQPVSVIFIDLNRFKPINDTYGHDAGDLVLKTIAQRLKKILREADIIARLGGDEFIVALPNVASPQDIEKILAKIDDTIEEPITLANGKQVSLSASLGVAIYYGEKPITADLVDQLINRADEKMYLEKTKNHNAR
jgi:diguanylate cyclase (GGDEF)-like protein